MESEKSLDLNNLPSHQSGVEGLLSLREAGSISGFHKNYLASLIRNKELRAVKVGFAWFIPKEEFQKFLDGKVKYKRTPPYQGGKTKTFPLLTKEGVGEVERSEKEIVNAEVDSWDKNIFAKADELQKKIFDFQARAKNS